VEAMYNASLRTRSMTSFQDYFSKQAVEYARYRPHYPGELFAYLASVSPGHQLAWDCGTGNGQAAHELVKHFNRVVATDASSDQLAQAIAHERIEYRNERAEDVSLESHSVDLVTVAIAVHWFALEQFYQAVRRVLVPNGVIAVWTYHLPVIEPAIDRVLLHYYRDTLAGYWPEQMRYLDERYRTLPFPFDPLQPPEFSIQADWDLAHIVGFLDSWSATRKYQQERGQHPINLIWPELREAWGEPGRLRSIRWPLYLKVGRV
jgi:ubiquinone/menaquinone biosynthesis C-methylase UbiE